MKNTLRKIVLLVIVLLSAQCTDVRVNQVTPALFELADTPETMAKVPVPAIEEIVRCAVRAAVRVRRWWRFTPEEEV